MFRETFMSANRESLAELPSVLKSANDKLCRKLQQLAKRIHHALISITITA